MAKKDKPGTALVNWDEELAKYAKETTEDIKETGGGKFLSFKGGNMTYNGEAIPDSVLDCVVVGYVYHNALYDQEERYDPKNPQTPICYSFGTKEKLLSPHDDSKDQKCDSCAACPFNQFETAKTGKGKACKNTFRLALISAAELDDIENAEVVYASIPPTSMKNFTAYLKEIDKKFGRPYWAVETKLSCEPDTGSTFKVFFEQTGIIQENKKLQALKDKWIGEMKTIDFPYQERVVEEKPAKKTAAKPAAKNKFSRK